MDLQDRVSIEELTELKRTYVALERYCAIRDCRIA